MSAAVPEGGVHSERNAAWLGISLGVAFGICFLTGLLSHLIQHPPGWFVWPARPAGLYRVTQGLHVATGIAAIPLLLVKNGIRIVTLSLLSIYVDPGFLTGSLHRSGGILFFILALVILAPVLWILQRSKPTASPAP